MIILISVAVIALLVCLGAGYEWQAESLARKKYASPPGKLVEIDDGKIHLLESGTEHAGPVVVLEGGAGGFSLEWGRVQPLVAEFAHVVSVDRAGYGWSTPSTKPRTPRQVVEELQQALVEANLTQPLILAGHSLGGIYIREYARCYPDRVVGLVLVDAVHPHQWRERGISKPGNVLNMQVLRGLSHLGLLRLAARDFAKRMQMPDELGTAYAALMPRGIKQAVVEEVADLPDDPALPDRLAIPIAIISRTPDASKFSAILQRLQHDLSQLSAESRHIVATHSGHYIHLEEPASVIEAIRWVVAQTSRNPA